jgi:hypothetical protein
MLRANGTAVAADLPDQARAYAAEEFGRVPRHNSTDLLRRGSHGNWLLAVITRLFYQSAEFRGL